MGEQGRKIALGWGEGGREGEREKGGGRGRGEKRKVGKERETCRRESAAGRAGIGSVMPAGAVMHRTKIRP